jgi:hypothetical protein
MKRLFIILFLTCFASLSFSSPNDFGIKTAMFEKKKQKTSGFDKRRILIGPGLGFGASQRAFSLSIAPSVAYCLTDNFHVGTTLGFNYFQQAIDYQNINTLEQKTFKLKVPGYTAAVFARYLIANFLIINVQPELNSTKFIRDLEYNANGDLRDNSTRILVPSFLVGAGYTQRFSQYGYSGIMVGYDLLQNPNSNYYQTLDIRFAIMIDLFNR